MKQLNTFFLLALLLMGSIATAHASENDISAQEAHQLATAGNVILIDVRSVDEWEQTGLAVNSHPISMHQKGGIPKLEDDLLALLNGDKSQAIALICAGGVRSARVQDYLKSQGFKTIYNVKEGMVGGWFSSGWIEQGLPTVDYMSAGSF